MVPLIEKAITDPAVDVDKMQKLLDMQLIIMAKDSERAYIADFASMQAEFPSIQKRGKTQQSTYATFDDINDGTAPARGKYGFSLSFTPETTEGFMTITATMSHKDGHKETSAMTLPFDTSGNKTNVQAIGSALKYGMRYGIVALLSISTHDGDDTDAEGLHSTISNGERDRLIMACDTHEVEESRVLKYYTRKFKRDISDWSLLPAGSYDEVLAQIQKQSKK